MLKRFVIPKEYLREFIQKLLHSHEIIAPVKRDEIHIFERIKNFEEIDLNFINTIFPPKKYFLPHLENIFDYKGNRTRVSYDETPRIIFGIRPCDVNCLSRYDKVFLNEEFLDPYYFKRKENTLILSLNCSQAGENCFCTSLGTDKLNQGMFDLLFTEEEGENYLVEVGSKKGAKLINKNKKLFSPTDEKPKIKLTCKKKITEENLNKLNDPKNFNSKVWEEYAEKCLSCCSCTITCPTCTCFGLRDIINLDLESGSRKREWQSCQLKVFTKVAGEYVFREERHKRLKHRIYHQLNYFKKKYGKNGKNLCVGCGRCIENCPTNIDMTEILQKL
jgi:NAD-dependent dihydropyrimidine dehydrogenase PreA subunit